MTDVLSFLSSDKPTTLLTVISRSFTPTPTKSLFCCFVIFVSPEVASEEDVPYEEEQQRCDDNPYHKNVVESFEFYDEDPFDGGSFWVGKRKEKKRRNERFSSLEGKKRKRLRPMYHASAEDIILALLAMLLSLHLPHHILSLRMDVVCVCVWTF